ncbi:hypothetical protein A2291_02350 [candidate division WOR-1 bacterium RIFOXYB2_FULL_42_35]|uniref:POTRA domain-containing protein n=1 Tax=candidate division WOR-1 bacterium RIFOXYC2_FULL_41_25 TaxID=1802586 RepID=A0A1F4TR51_UNCSA|nr:MAG: hypothetical protein A2247_07275 [candidate division WOR-1 bacterium RIFOXYA2_FULL_41_14]OGC25404.1 MAG: hypothetical protein A2291_02350 [candidate division WOR-1 bacterium RIFOXYB2_FULL_42_35]OGC35204.1 MAG: hypothetical protein A2462_07585 [candidate division WOR-1 bacterium RIFOXYC2_FULL_41_25]OGC42992.1 MAG: hypothetical protein A2548_04850 [candidate division WOR-1 bacterium RIFOXYD2_FULL_41_8]
MVKRKRKVTKSRRRRKGRLFVWLFFLILLIGLTYYILSLPIWQIKYVVVNGTQMLSANEIRTMASVPLSGNLFFSNLSRTKSNLKSITAISDFNIYRIPPATILINIKERQPVAAIVFSDQSFFIDEQGYVLNRNPNLSLNIPNLPDLPVIAGMDRAAVLKVDRLDNKIARVVLEVVVKLARFLDLKNIRLELAGVDNITLLLDDVLRVKLGDYNDIQKKMQVFKALLPVMAGRWSSVVYVDVRYPDNPVIKYK